MASGTPQHQHQQQQQQKHHHLQQQQQHHHQQQQQQQQQQQPQQPHEHLMQNHHMQSSFAPSHPVNIGTHIYDHQHQQQQQMPQYSSTMSPNSTPISINHHMQGHTISLNPQQQQEQTTQLLPLLLSPQPTSLTPNLNDHLEQSQNDHDQIIDQVISLDDEYSETSVMIRRQDQQPQQAQQQQQQQQLPHLSDINLSGTCMPDSTSSSSNQFLFASDDLLNMLVEYEPLNEVGLGVSQQLDQDEKVGIENIRKQLMSCDVQSDNNSMSPIVNNQQINCQPQQSQRVQQQQQQQHHISQVAPVISQQQQQMSTSNTSQQHRQQQMMSPDQTTLLHGSYSSVSMNTVPASTSSQSYTHINTITQSNPLSVVNDIPAPSWQQQPQLSPYSSPPPPSTPHNTTRTHLVLHHHQQSQQQSLQQRSPKHSVSPPATTEPSPVVKKNPLLNAQLVNSRAPPATPSRYSQANVLNQNPILNAKLSQSPSPSSQSRFIQQHQQQNAHSFQQPGHMNLYGSLDHHQQQQHHQQQTSNSPSCINSGRVVTSVTNPTGGLNQQVKQEIRKVQQPKQQHQTTSLLKQLLSDDNK